MRTKIQSRAHEYTIEDLRRHLKKYGVADGLQLINRVSRWIYRERKGTAGIGFLPEGPIGQWDLAFVAKELIYCSNDHRSGRFSLDPDGFRNALGIVNNMRDPTLNDDVETTLEGFHNFLIRTAYQQFRYQGWAESALFRSYLLYDKMWKLLPQDFDMDEAYSKVYGLPIKTFLAIGFCVLALAGSDHPQFQKAALTNVRDEQLSELKPILTAENLQRFMLHTTVDYYAFRDLCNRFPIDPEYARFGLNPLELRPVIRTQAQNEVFVVPSLTSLLLRFTDGLYYDLFNHYREHGDPHSFTSFFGKVFERYVGEQLKAHYGGERVIGERKYPASGGEWSGPDWIVVEGDSALLVECKASRLPLVAKTKADFASIETEVIAKMFDVVRRFPAKIRHLRQYSAVWPELAGVDRFYPVVVTMEPCWPAQPFHEIIDAKLREDGIDHAPYHIISVKDLEDLLKLVPHGITISSILDERIAQNKQGFSLDQSISNKIREAGISTENLLMSSARNQFLGDVLIVRRPGKPK